jgi:hypothetical protein
MGRKSLLPLDVMRKTLFGLVEGALGWKPCFVRPCVLPDIGNGRVIKSRGEEHFLEDLRPQETILCYENDRGLEDTI